MLCRDNIRFLDVILIWAVKFSWKYPFCSSSATSSWDWLKISAILTQTEQENGKYGVMPGQYHIYGYNFDLSWKIFLKISFLLSFCPILLRLVENFSYFISNEARKFKYWKALCRDKKSSLCLPWYFVCFKLVNIVSITFVSILWKLSVQIYIFSYTFLEENSIFCVVLCRDI